MKQIILFFGAGTLAVGVPGQIAGFWEAHQRFGVLPWKRLFEPAIKLARNGHVIQRDLGKVIASCESDIHFSPNNLW